MAQKDRLKLLKKAAAQLVDSLTMADYLGVVEFNTDAKTFLNLNFLAPAAKPFRQKVKGYIEGMESGGRTNYADAFQLAFKMADTSYKQNYDSGCQTAYVFLTDGEQTEGSAQYADIVQNRKKAAARTEMFIIIGLGNDVAPGTDAGKALKKLSCMTDGIFESVADVADFCKFVSMSLI